MKKVIFALVALSFAATVAAGNGNGNNGNGNGNGGGNGNVNSGVGVGGVAGIGGQASVFAGSVSGSAGSITRGEAVSATFISGQGFSNQMTTGSTIGSATAGGFVGSDGVTANTASYQKTDFSSLGSIGGGAEGLNANSQILNGTQGFGSIENTASSNGDFAAGAIGGGLVIGGFTAIGGF